ncbi:hypothetical protein SAMN06298214_0543 [Bacteroidales bacterium WCE2004]|nr:hypothetical protein SAMN06298214_0543 [Bacteroidales bacterium WCE2004]
MKKVSALVSAAILLLAGSSKLNAQVEEYYYGFITSCGTVEYVDTCYEMSDEECLEWFDLFEYLDCEFDYGL